MFGFIQFVYGLLFATVPSGLYSGSKSLFGETINAVVDLKSATTLDFGITGDFTLADCKDELYTISSPNILITNISILIRHIRLNPGYLNYLIC